MLRAPDFPPSFSYLFDWYGEFLMWCDRERVPSWSDWQAWATLMQRPASPFDLRMLHRIHVAYCMSQRSQSDG